MILPFDFAQGDGVYIVLLSVVQFLFRIKVFTQHRSVGSVFLILLHPDLLILVITTCLSVILSGVEGRKSEILDLRRPHLFKSIY